MAADLTIHIVDGISEEDVIDFLGNSFGSKHFSWARVRRAQDDDDLYSRVEGTPHVAVGEVSWLKAALSGDAGTYVPDPIQGVCNAIGEDLPVIDGDLIARVAAALQAPNTTGYDMEDPARIAAFLAEHRGKRCFTVSW